MVYFELPVCAFVILDPCFKFFDRSDACTLEHEFALRSDTFDAGEGCGLKEFEMFTDPLECEGVVFCMVLSEGTSEEMPVYIA